MKYAKLFALQLSFLLSSQIVAAQLPTTWKPYDVVTYFCQRWFHQCTYSLRSILERYNNTNRSHRQGQHAVHLWGDPDLQPP